MIKLTTLFKNFKKKIAMGALGASLIVAPGGVALAHGSYHQHDDNQRTGQHWSDSDHNKRKSDWQKTCEERQAKADQKIADFKAKAQARYNGLSMYLGTQQGFVVNNNLTIDNYDEFNTKAMEAQANAQQALDDIESPDINCHHSPRHDKEQIRRAEHELRKAIKKFNASLDDLSELIADEVAVS